MNKAECLFIKLAESRDILGLTFVPKDVLKSYFGEEFVAKRDQIIADPLLDEKTKRKRLTNALVDVYLSKVK